MKATSSPLVQLSFDIIKSRIFTVFGNDPTADLLRLTKSYSIDIDFTIEHQESKDIFVVLVGLEINPDEQPGYSISVEGAGVFTFSNIIDENQKQSLVHSAVNICITNLRAYINSVTAFHPLGRFSLDVSDMIALFKNKWDLKSSE
jgi:preprotein translocase subunit SecB